MGLFSWTQQELKKDGHIDLLQQWTEPWRWLVQMKVHRSTSPHDEKKTKNRQITEKPKMVAQHEVPTSDLDDITRRPPSPPCCVWSWSSGCLVTQPDGTPVLNRQPRCVGSANMSNYVSFNFWKSFERANVTTCPWTKDVKLENEKRKKKHCCPARHRENRRRRRP